MTPKILQRDVWALVRRQHGVVTRSQLRERGYSSDAIKHRVAIGRLHPVYAGVYAVGRRELTPYGRWMAAVLSCGDHAVLSHQSAAALWGIRADRGGPIHITVPPGVCRQRAGIVIHRQALRKRDTTARYGIRVTTPIVTVIDLATQIDRDEMEQAINEADVRGLTNPEKLRRALDEMPRRPGAATLRTLLDRRTFRLSRSRLERLFRPIARRAGLPPPLTRMYVNGFEVDFYWPELDLVVETDGLTYHRTPQQQNADLVRDQTHTVKETARLRFSHAQVRFEPGYVESVLASIATRLRLRAS